MNVPLALDKGYDVNVPSIVTRTIAEWAASLSHMYLPFGSACMNMNFDPAGALNILHVCGECPFCRIAVSNGR